MRYVNYRMARRLLCSSSVPSGGGRNVGWPLLSLPRENDGLVENSAL